MKKILAILMALIAGAISMSVLGTAMNWASADFPDLFSKIDEYCRHASADDCLQYAKSAKGEIPGPPIDTSKWTLPPLHIEKWQLPPLDISNWGIPQILKSRTDLTESSFFKLR
jgi:hypothetical protein